MFVNGLKCGAEYPTDDGIVVAAIYWPTSRPNIRQQNRVHDAVENRFTVCSTRQRV